MIDVYKCVIDEGCIVKGVFDSGYFKKLEDLVVGVVDVRNLVEIKIYFMCCILCDFFVIDFV